VRIKILAAVVACVAVAAPLALADAGTQTQNLRLTESEWGIAGVPKTIKAGSPIHVTVTNKGGIPHELVLEAGQCAKQCALRIGGHNAEIEGVRPGVTKSATWTITKPGTYTFTCRVPGHWKAGMRQTFTVT
jgi:uncharacterized cupredoxin-like copper-binding protein